MSVPRDGDAGVTPVAVDVRRDEVIRFLGYPEGRVPSAGVAALLDDTLAEAGRLARPRGAFARLPVERAADVGLRPLDARGLVLGLVTIGRALETRVTELCERGQHARALLLDAAGSAAAEQAADRLGARIAGDPEAGERARDLPCRLSPGYGGWPLAAQPALMARLPAGALGVELLPSLLMVPRKSISFAMWLGAAVPPAQGRAGCAECTLGRCPYRRRRR